ncbi:MAG: flagellar protein FlgN [Lachnospiraceae bacterium]|nr:flagellar protein FlgN [Lachnospiraceae bacterium]
MTERVGDLIAVLKEETACYDKLYEFAQDKRDYVINRKLAELEKLTSDEQNISSRLKNLEKKRLGLIAELLSGSDHAKEDETVTKVIALFEEDSEERKGITAARDALVASATRMQFLNQQNEILLKQALEMVEFDLTLFKSLRQAPETANYNRNAYSTGDFLPSSGFDAKQ